MSYVVKEMGSKRKREASDNGSRPNKKFKCLRCEKSFDRYLNKRYHKQSTHGIRHAIDLVGGSKKDESHTYTLDEYTSDQSIDEQPYQKVVVDVKNLDELKKDVRNVIHK